MFIFRGKLERGPFLVNVKLLQIMFGFALSIVSGGKETPIVIVIKQLSNNIAKKMMPFISELNSADNAKKLIKMNGANLNPIYVMDCTFNTFIILYLMLIYKSYILFVIWMIEIDRHELQLNYYATKQTAVHSRSFLQTFQLCVHFHFIVL